MTSLFFRQVFVLVPSTQMLWYVCHFLAIFLKVTFHSCFFVFFLNVITLLLGCAVSWFLRDFWLLQDGFGLDRTLDLASTLEGGNDLRLNGDAKSSNSPGQMRSVLTIAFQFAYEVHTRETVAAMARQYVRNVVASVQQVAMALAPSRGTPPPRQVPSNPDALSLVRHVLSSYRYFPYARTTPDYHHIFCNFPP